MSKRPACPECGSERLFKDGKRRLSDGSKVQRYLCRDCGYRFTDPKVRQILKVRWGTLSNTAQRAVQLMEVKEENKGSLKTRETTKKIDNLLFNFAWHLKKNGYSESTIQSQVKRLRILARRGADLYDPESVKDTIARQKWSPSTRLNAVHAYTNFLQYIKGEWNPPNYRRINNLPFIPYERELDELIAGCSRTISTFLQLLKETGMRAGEAYNLTWDQIDFERGTVTITPEKGSNPRIFSLSNKLLNMLSQLRKKELKGSIFGYGNLRYLRRTFERQKKSLAHKLGNPRLKRISFHTFRHWKATMLYHQTKDILYVMRFLGHKNITNTLIYVQLEEALFKKEPEEYICKTAETVEEAKRLVEAGFEYVCEVEGVQLFRKRK